MYTATMDALVSLCKRRGFIYQSSEIYNGLQSVWDYGPLGIELKKNIQAYWWKHMVQFNENIVGLDSSIFMHPKVWQASGHVENFVDIMVEDTVTHERYRFDHLTSEQRSSCVSPKGNPLSKPREFNLMFKTSMGSTTEKGHEIYLRPETAQGIYVNFKNVVQTMRLKLPFGIAQVGKAFRNEIVTKNFIFRTCEFEQLEMQYFVHPNEAGQWYEHWKSARLNYYKGLHIAPDNLNFHIHGADQLAHYAQEACDIEYKFPFGFSELEGIHNRGDYDLKRHSEFSGKDLSYTGEDNEKFFPYIIETSSGLTRCLLMVLCESLDEETLQNGEVRSVLRLPPQIAPYSATVLPLQKKDGLADRAKKIFHELQKEHMVYYDQGGAIGRRYRRQDEIGTPLCITVDYESKENNTVTVRDRDSMQQRRIPIPALLDYVRNNKNKDLS